MRRRAYGAGSGSWFTCSMSGQCIRYVMPDGGIGRSSCVGVDQEVHSPGHRYSALGTWMLGGHADIARPISYHGKDYGALVVTTDTAVVLAATGGASRGLLGLTALVVVAICVLQFVAIGRALRPTRHILAGLDRLAVGDLSCRLPNFGLIELQRISEVFNTLAASLDRTTRERAPPWPPGSWMGRSRNAAIWPGSCTM